MCREDEKCVGVTYYPEEAGATFAGKCSMHSSMIGEHVPADGNVHNVLSVWKPLLATGWVLQPQLDCVHTPEQQVHGLTSVSECALASVNQAKAGTANAGFMLVDSECFVVTDFTDCSVNEKATAGWRVESSDTQFPDFVLDVCVDYLRQEENDLAASNPVDSTNKFKQRSIQNCAAECNGNAQCVAFSFDLTAEPGKQCFLKKATVPVLISNTNCNVISALRISAKPSGFGVVGGAAIVGPSLAAAPLTAPLYSIAECASQCSINADCLAFSLARFGPARGVCSFFGAATATRLAVTIARQKYASVYGVRTEVGEKRLLDNAVNQGDNGENSVHIKDYYVHLKEVELTNPDGFHGGVFTLVLHELGGVTALEASGLLTKDHDFVTEALTSVVRGLYAEETNPQDRIRVSFERTDVPQYELVFLPRTEPSQKSWKELTDFLAKPATLLQLTAALKTALRKGGENSSTPLTPAGVTYVDEVSVHNL